MDQFLNLSTNLLAAAEKEAHGGGGGEHHGASFFGLAVYTAFVLIIIAAFLIAARRGMKDRVFKNPWTQRFEQIYVFIESLCLNTIGPHGRKYIPFITTLWLVVFVSNLVALFFDTSPTADLSFNLGLAFIAVGYVQWEGIKANGVIGHFSHFAGPKLGIALIPVTILIFVIEIISELMKNVSLSLRLFGNIDGGHQAAVAMNVLGEDIYVPFGSFLLPIKLLTVVVQALIFCLLTCVYLSLVTHHEDDHGHDHDHAPEGAPVPAH